MLNMKGRGKWAGVEIKKGALMRPLTEQDYVFISL
jgi:hypothetical protein